MSVRQMLLQLQKRGMAINIVGALNFDSEDAGKWVDKHVRKIPDKDYINFIDDTLVHQCAITKSKSKNDMTISEVNKWYSLFINQLDKFKPDLVFFYGGQPQDFLIADEARRRGVPTAFYLVNGNYHGQRWCQDIDIIITDTNATSDYYKSRQSINVKPCGKFIDTNQIVAKRHERKNVLFINPSLSKGSVIVAKIALILEYERPDIHFEVVNSRGDWKKVVRAVTSDQGDERDSLSNVSVIQQTRDMKSIYSRTRLLLAPSLWWESGARVLAEAMLNGIPCIVSDYGGNAEMIGDGGIKVTFPQEFHEKPYNTSPPIESLKPIADAICKFYDDESYYQKFVEKANLVGSSKHNIENSTDKLISEFSPFLEMRAGDTSFQAKLKGQHKHAISGDLENDLPHPLTLRQNLSKTEKGLFIDCGGFDGCSAIKFILENPNFDAVTFEPNPIFEQYYTDVPTTLLRKAAWIQDGKIEFIIDDLNGDGSTVIKSKQVDHHGVLANEDCTKINADTVNIVSLIQKASEKYDKIILKLDVEGAEYEILETLLDSDQLRNVDRLYAEFHWIKCGFSQDRHDRLIQLLLKETEVFYWDALEYSVHVSEDRDRAIKKRREMVLNKLGKLQKYQAAEIVG